MKAFLLLLTGAIVGSCVTLVAAGYMYVDAYRKSDIYWRE